METGGVNCKSPKLLVHSCRKLNQKSSEANTLYGDDTGLNLSTDHESEVVKGQLLDNSIQPTDDGLDLPIALRNVIGSCTQIWRQGELTISHPSYLFTHAGN